MKRLGIIVGVFFLISGTTLWAQSNAATARQQADEAAKAKADDALRSTELQLQLQKLPNLRSEIQNGLAQLPNISTSIAPFGDYSYRFYAPSSSTDPLAALQVAPGTWWNNNDTVTRLNLTKDQQRKMDDIFQQFRLKLIDLNAALSKEELIMDPLIASERLDEAKILTQIDRIAQARAELEKANSRMLLGIRQTLTMEQWTKIQASPGSYRVNRVIAPRR